MKLKPEDRIEIERFGGLAGVGLPGSRIRSRVLLRGSDLSDAERASIEKAFNKRAAGDDNPTNADAFRYHITIHNEGGSEELDAGPGNLMESLQNRIQDELI